MSKYICLIFFLLFQHLMIIGQTIPVGKYVGYENMYKYSKSNGYFIPGIYHTKQMDTTKYWFHSNKWFHEVTIDVVSDTCINITKVPVYFINGNKVYSDSIGGFYNYNCASIAIYSENAPWNIKGKKFITGSITKCKYCHVGGTAVPRYTYCNYNINIDDNGDLILSTEFGKVVYKKKNNLLRDY